MRVTFVKLADRRASSWEAVRGKRTRVPGPVMPLGKGGRPHDLEQLVVEATLGIDRGFWGSIAAGATFRSTGRKRTGPGREIIRRNKQHLDDAEAVAGEHVRRWEEGEDTPCAGPLDELARRWAELGDGDSLTVVWPSLDVLDSSAIDERSPRR
jgi:hypothetical protein